VSLAPGRNALECDTSRASRPSAQVVQHVVDLAIRCLIGFSLVAGWCSAGGPPASRRGWVRNLPVGVACPVAGRHAASPWRRERMQPRPRGAVEHRLAPEGVSDRDLGLSPRSAPHGVWRSAQLWVVQAPKARSVAFRGCEAASISGCFPAKAGWRRRRCCHCLC